MTVDSSCYPIFWDYVTSMSDQAKPMFGIKFSDGTMASCGGSRTKNPNLAYVFSRDEKEAEVIAKRMGGEPVRLDASWL